MRFTDTHTVFIFILVSFYRTFLRFPHRPTIPAYEIRSHCITCIICFLAGDIQAPGRRHNYYSALPIFNTYRSITRSLASRIFRYYYYFYRCLFYIVILRYGTLARIYPVNACKIFCIH